MLLDTDLTRRLLGAIETNDLIFLCGAGLSRAFPSDLPSAVAVSRMCFDRWQPIERLEGSLRDDLDALASFFYARRDFENVFLKIVPWNELVGLPNPGHAAIADLLIVRGAHSAMSSNFDGLIETWAEAHKVELQGSLDGHEAANQTATNPLLKFHGCMRRAKSRTLWTRLQLSEASVKHRVESCSQWMNLHLPGKHLVVVGFWTDWGYLNEVIGDAFSVTNAAAVTVIDPKNDAELQLSAPNLWARLQASSTAFNHVQASAAEALDELRTSYSRQWARKFYSFGKELMSLTHLPVRVEEPFDSLTGDALYDVRRDAEGVSYARAATLKHPPQTASQASYFWAQLLNAGAAVNGAWLDLRGTSIRVLNGAGRELGAMWEAHVEPPTIDEPDVCVCAGAIDLGVPGRVVSSGFGKSSVRPAPGGKARWLTLEQASTEFAI